MFQQLKYNLHASKIKLLILPDNFARADTPPDLQFYQNEKDSMVVQCPMFEKLQYSRGVRNSELILKQIIYKNLSDMLAGQV